MQPPGPFCELGGHYAIDLDGARAVFTTRRGGYSAGPYRSLNLGAHTDDDLRVVARNRDALRAAVDAPPLSFVHQVHGAEVRRVTGPTPLPCEHPRADHDLQEVGALSQPTEDAVDDAALHRPE